jgi:uncharacterized protein YqgC (DUF456 family)
MFDSVLELIFAVFIFASMVSNFFGAPGNLLITINSFVYGIITNYADYSFGFVISLFLIMLLVEALEYVLIVLTAKKYGASKWGITGSIVGGIGGAISGAFVTPIMGAIIGSIIGVFLGATILEFFKSYQIKEALLSGVGAFLGKLGGLSIKTCGAITMIIMIFYQIY